MSAGSERKAPRCGGDVMRTRTSGSASCVVLDAAERGVWGNGGANDIGEFCERGIGDVWGEPLI